MYMPCSLALSFAAKTRPCHLLLLQQDRVVLGKLGDDSIATMGASKPLVDYEAAWRREMGVPKKEDDKTGTPGTPCNLGGCWTARD